MTGPSLTAILVTCDRPALLADALRSVAEQTRSVVEVRVTDNGTRPAPWRELIPLGLTLDVLPGGGITLAAARNRAARGARGDVLLFLDDDDRWRPDHVQRMAETFSDSTVEIAWRDAEVVKERVEADGARITLERRPLAHAWDPAMMSVNDWIPPSAIGVRRAFFERLGGFDEGFVISEDWDFLLRAARESLPRRIPGIGVEVRMRDTGHLSQEAGPERRAHLERLVTRHGLPPLEPRTFWEVAQVLAEGRAR